MADDSTGPEEHLIKLLTELVALRQTLEKVVSQNEDLLEQLRERNRRIAELEEELEKTRREGKRQAAPFRRRDSRKKPAQKHRRPGRKTGHKGASRPTPTEDEVDHHHRVELTQCPGCGGDDLGELRPVEQFVEDIEMRRVVHRIVTHRGECAQCGTVRSEHPLQVSEASGAAGVALGPRALALALDLNKRLGLTTRKTCEVLSTHLGLSLTPGGLVQASHRLADRLAPDYEGLVERLRDSAAVYVDETSWWVGEPGWWLWGLTDGEGTTAYAVRPHRGGKLVGEMLGPDFEGILSSDCLNIYDNQPYAQNKCYAHHLRALSRAREQRPLSGYLDEVRLLLRCALSGRDGDDEAREELVERLEGWALRLLSKPRADKVEEGLRKRLSKQREHLFTFLRHPEVDATNNAAERALRPAVIARKLSCGNRTERGAKTWEILASLATSSAKTEGVAFHALIERATRLQSSQQPNSPPN